MSRRVVTTQGIQALQRRGASDSLLRAAAKNTDRRRTTAMRCLVNVRWGNWKDRQCRKHGHKIIDCVSVRVLSGNYWPICSRCGRGVEP